MEYVGKSKSAKKKKKPVLWIVLSIVAIIQIFPLIWLLDFSLASSNEMFTSSYMSNKAESALRKLRAMGD